MLICFGCESSLTLVAGVMCPLHVSFVVLTHRWVSPIYAVNVVATLMVCVDIYVVLLPHILAWNYTLLVYGNNNSF